VGPRKVKEINLKGVHQRLGQDVSHGKERKGVGREKTRFKRREKQREAKNAEENRGPGSQGSPLGTTILGITRKISESQGKNHEKES